MRIRFYFIIFTIGTQLVVSNADSQVFVDKAMPFVQNFSPEDYDAEPQNWSIVEDPRGIMYFGNTDGILEFDGVNWELIKTKNNTIVRSMSVSDDSVIYVGASNDFGYLETYGTGQIKYVSLRDKFNLNFSDFQDVWKTYALGNEIYFFADKAIFRYFDNKISVIKINLAANLAYKVGNNIFVVSAKGGIYGLKNGKLLLLPFTEEIKPYEVGRELILPYKNNELLILTNYGGFYTYKLNYLNEDFQLINNSRTANELLIPFKSEVEKYIRYGMLYEASTFNDTLIAFGTNRNGVFLMDYSGKLIDFANKTSGLPSNSIYFLFTDKTNLMWVGTEMGISLIDFNSPLRVYNTNNNIEGSVLTTYSKNGYRYVGSMQQLYYHKAEPLSIKNPKEQFKKVKNVYEDSWQLLAWKDKVISLSSYGLQFITDSLGEDYNFFGNSSCATFIKNKPNRLFVGLIDGLLSITLVNEKSRKYPKIVVNNKYDFINDAVNDLVVDKHGSLWISSYYDGILKAEFDSLSLDSPRFTRYNKDNGLPQGSFNFPILLKDSLLRFVTTKGIYEFNSENQVFNQDKTFSIFNNDSLPIKQLIDDNNGRYWYLSDNEAGYVYLDQNKWVKNDSVFKNISINAIHKIFLEDSALWIASNLGLYKYSFNQKYTFHKEINLLIREVVAGEDSVLFSGTYFTLNSNGLSRVSTEQRNSMIYTLDYELNNLKFKFSGKTNQLGAKVEYQTILVGYDKLPSIWFKETSKHYTNLGEGTYTFKVRARNKYGNLSDWVEYRFRIKPPFYRSLLAYVFYFLLSLFILRVSTIFYSRRLKKINQKLEELVQIRTSEIASQKFEIEKHRELLEKNNLELEKLSIVARETDNAILILDTKGNIEWVNEGFVKRYGYTLEECIYGENKNIMHYSQNSLVMETIANCVAFKRSFSYEILSKTKSGNEIWAHTTLTPIISSKGKINRIIAIDSDINKLKEAESEIYQQKEEIETQRNLLSELNATKDRFFSIIAHDLRGPLGTVINSSGMLAENYELFDDKERKSLLIEIHKASFSTFNLLENLLHWSRSQRGEISFRPENIDLTLLINETLELLTISATNKGILIDNLVEKDYYAFADENMISTVLRNLMSNALKFTKKDGRIQISVTEESDFYLVSIKDTGIGMSKERLNKLFKLDSYTSLAGTNNEKGTGLGLILSSEFIHKNNGKIWCTSKLGIGSVFNFTVPKA